MFETTLADNVLVALPEAANDPVFHAHAPGKVLSDNDAGAMLQGVEPLGRRRIAAVRFRESGAAMFRPFRVY
jgi:hypothetical protein